MKILLLLLLASCSVQERAVQQSCELKCTECDYVEIKCDVKNKADNKDLGK